MTSSPPETRLWEFPGRTIRLELELDVPRTVQAQLAAAGTALQGLFGFCAGFCEPLSVDLTIDYLNADLDTASGNRTLEHRYWLLSKDQLPPGAVVEPAWADERRLGVGSLTQESVHAFTAQVLAQAPAGDPGHPGHPADTVGWTEMLFRATMARLPATMNLRSRTELEVAAGSGSITCPIERRDSDLWVWGPRASSSIEPPLWLGLGKQHGLLTLDIGLLWSCWADPDSPGRPDVDRGVATLIDLGWTLA